MLEYLPSVVSEEKVYSFKCTPLFRRWRKRKEEWGSKHKEWKFFVRKTRRWNVIKARRRRKNEGRKAATEREVTITRVRLMKEKCK